MFFDYSGEKIVFFDYSGELFVFFIIPASCSGQFDFSGELGITGDPLGITDVFLPAWAIPAILGALPATWVLPATRGKELAATWSPVKPSILVVNAARISSTGTRLIPFLRLSVFLTVYLILTHIGLWFI